MALSEQASLFLARRLSQRIAAISPVYVREITHDKAAGALPPKDGNLAYRHALKADELAVKTYFRTLNDFKAALSPRRAFAKCGW